MVPEPYYAVWNHWHIIILSDFYLSQSFKYDNKSLPKYNEYNENDDASESRANFGLYVESKKHLNLSTQSKGFSHVLLYTASIEIS